MSLVLHLHICNLQVGWYNDQVNNDVFKLSYPPDTLAVLLISTPDMFELLFKPYSVSKPSWSVDNDPLDHCIKQYLTGLVMKFPEHQIDLIMDYELDTLRRPKLLVQTAGHVAGAAYYYQRQCLGEHPWTIDDTIYGVSMHPKYGGWFAFRGALIFRTALAPQLTRRFPVDCVPSHEMRLKLFDEFNHHWREWSYRDVIQGQVEKRYSEEQKIYFATLPSNRHELIANGTPV